MSSIETIARGKESKTSVLSVWKNDNLKLWKNVIEIYKYWTSKYDGQLSPSIVVITVFH